MPDPSRWRNAGSDLRRALVAATHGEGVDAAGLFPALAKSLRSTGPAAVTPVAKYAVGMAGAAIGTVAAFLGVDPSGPVALDPADRRFRDVAWRKNPLFVWQQQSYLLACRLLDELIDAADVPDTVSRKAGLAAEFVKAASAPTNYLWGNPEALKRAFETGGLSLIAGFRRFVADAVNNRALPSQVDSAAFKVGVDLAATPGMVVYRNELIELIQYAPQTDQTHAIPLLCSPPWINKYYIMDLAPGRSFIEWAVKHGHTTFAISYRNPDASMSDTSFEDYLFKGPLQALDVIEDITGQPQVNIVALCLGGTLTTILLGYLAAAGEDRVNAVTLLNTLIDFEGAGVLTAFTDEESLNRLEERWSREGTLKAESMQRTFDLLRPQDLIFNYIGPGWLMGEPPPAFDILAWNADGTAMPAAMHIAYLRSCYLENRLALGTLVFGGRHIDLSRVATDMFVVGAENDHIAPWHASYRSTQLLPKSDVQYLLSSAGHIAGVVNPPSPKAKYRINETYPPDPADWLAGVVSVQESWWEAWSKWMSKRAGPQTTPPPAGSERFPILGAAPGSYVFG